MSKFDAKHIKKYFFFGKRILMYSLLKKKNSDFHRGL